jgi:hypothetical protein
MLHPHTELRLVNNRKGRGVFATEAIPMGTLTYVIDALEILIAPNDARLSDDRYSALIEKFSFIDGDGTRIFSWDHAKYVNHCCQCNTLSTGYGFEIAIRDIAKGEEITDEYGMFNLGYDIKLDCDRFPCRGWATGQDLSKYHEQWDEAVKIALRNFHSVHQPLGMYVDDETLRQLNEYLKFGTNYQSVKLLEHVQR